jgi:hypothetical protein
MRTEKGVQCRASGSSDFSARLFAVYDGAETVQCEGLSGVASGANTHIGVLQEVSFRCNRMYVGIQRVCHGSAYATEGSVAVCFAQCFQTLRKYAALKGSNGRSGATISPAV